MRKRIPKWDSDLSAGIAGRPRARLRGKHTFAGVATAPVIASDQQDGVTGVLVLAWVRRVLLFVGLMFAASPVGSALADTTVGQTGTPPSDFETGFEIVQTSAAMPAAGLVTSFHFQSSMCDLESGAYDFQVLRPLGGGQYRVLGEAGNQTDPCDSQFHSYSVSIPVQAGDVIGVYVVKAWQGLLDVDSAPTSASDPIPQPVVGETVTLEDDSSPLNVTIDESATLVTAPTSKAQCTHGGWKNFPQFKNQGDCVSFVATGGKNPPTGS